jgi:hypothetical protein
MKVRLSSVTIEGPGQKRNTKHQNAETILFAKPKKNNKSKTYGSKLFHVKIEFHKTDAPSFLYGEQLKLPFHGTGSERQGIDFCDP